MAKSADVASFRESCNRSLKSSQGGGRKTTGPSSPVVEPAKGNLEEVKSRGSNRLDRGDTNTSVDLDEAEEIEKRRKEEQ